MQYNYSNDSVEGAHSSTKTDSQNTRKHSPMNVSAVVRESAGFNIKPQVSKEATSVSFSRNKMSKNKTLPNLFNYTGKQPGLINSSTRAITKQFMNPNRKYYDSKKGNKTFIEPKTPNQPHVVKNRVYESGSTSRSGGTGEPNYIELKRRAREKCLLASGSERDSTPLSQNSITQSHQNLYLTKINALTKENTKLKLDFERVKKDMANMDKTLEATKKLVADQNDKIKNLTHQLSQRDLEIIKIKEEFEQERETEAKIVTEYINAENYLLELVDEFTNGMRKIYANDIEFKDVDIAGLPFCERFSNLLYNILLIIDFQKQFIVEQSNSNPQQYFNNE